MLCVGLDTDPARIPACLRNEPDPVLAFHKAIVEATADLCIAYKPNLAFFEAMGPAGMECFARTVECLPSEALCIADAKRGDIGNTADRYAHAFYDVYGVDAVTLHAYMGRDSVQPFLGRTGKWAVVLGLTSNSGAADFQEKSAADGRPFYRHMVDAALSWGSHEDTMLVVGATRPAALAALRADFPQHFFLVPGIGAQGGDLEAVMRAGCTSHNNLIINASRSILYASSGSDFAEKAREAAQDLSKKMADLMTGRP
ncbi:MAG: orotidine-5'-phosphate decarboxylase [Bacteroidetes bacterium]|nr:orotidine-5'-phosphate decarboxylase [Bacteroidota bacterium]